MKNADKFARKTYRQVSFNKATYQAFVWECEQDFHLNVFVIKFITYI